MFDVPNEFVDIKQNEIDDKVDELWEEILHQVKTERSVKKCREILKRIDALHSQSVLLWRV